MEGKLGDLLRGAREGKGLSLAKAEQGTRIRQRYLQALEEGDYAALPEPVYAKGFLRNYAAFLGLNAEEILDQYYGERGLRSRDVAEVREQIHPLPRPSRRHRRRTGRSPPGTARSRGSGRWSRSVPRR